MATKHRSNARNERGLISLKKAASLADVDRKTILHWIEAGFLQGDKQNDGTWRVNIHELLALAHPVIVTDAGGVA